MRVLQRSWCRRPPPSNVTYIRREEKEINAKSIMSVMMLAASQGTTITISAEGVDADAALDALVALINDRFDESS